MTTWVSITLLAVVLVLYVAVPAFRPVVKFLLWGGMGVALVIMARALRRPLPPPAPPTDEVQDAESEAVQTAVGELRAIVRNDPGNAQLRAWLRARARTSASDRREQ